MEDHDTVPKALNLFVGEVRYINQHNMATAASVKQIVRLRQACDNCSSAKVRCDKKRPSCDRCAAMQLTCTFSPSRRHGKQSWQKRTECERAKAAAAAAAAAATQTQAQAHAHVQLATLPGLQTTASPSQGGESIASTLSSTSIRTPSNLLLDEQSWNSSLGYDFTALNGESHDLLKQSSANEALDSLQFWSRDDFQTGFDLGDLARSPLSTNDLSPTSAFELSNSTVPAESTGQPGKIHDGPSLSAPEPQNKAPSSSNSTTTTKSMHDCEARAITVLRSLHHSPVPHLNETTLLTATEQDLVPSFDKVLLANKAALNGWSELMSCTCASCPHLTFLYVSILSKVLFWYRVAAAASCPLVSNARSVSNNASSETQSPPHQTSSSTSSTPSSLDPPPRVEQFGVRPTTIQIGMLDLDQEDQANLRRVILLRELRKVEKAIDDMTSVSRNMDDDVAYEAAHRAGEFSAAGISKIRDELQDMIRKVKQSR